MRRIERFRLLVMAQTLGYHGSQVHSVAWSPDSARVASASQDGTVAIWDATPNCASSSARLRELQLGEAAYSVAWSPDGTKLATGSFVGAVWDAETGQRLQDLRHDYRVLSVAWAPDSRRLATGSADRTARVWDAGVGQLRLPHRAEVTSVAWAPDGARLATGSRDRRVRVWAAAGGPTDRQPEKTVWCDGHVYSVAWSADSAAVASGTDGGAIRVWGAAGEPRLTLHHPKIVYSLSWAHGLLASASDERVRVWDGGELIQELPLAARSVAWSPDGRALALGTAGDRVAIWRVGGRGLGVKGCA